jgi:hypothetical protein
MVPQIRYSPSGQFSNTDNRGFTTHGHNQNLLLFSRDQSIAMTLKDGLRPTSIGGSMG